MFGDRAFKEAVKIKCGHVDALYCDVSSEEEEIGTHTEERPYENARRRGPLSTS